MPTVAEDPSAPIAAVSLSYQDGAATLAYATFGQRLLACLLDSLIVAAMQIPVLTIGGLISSSLEAGGTNKEAAEAAVGFAMLSFFVLSGGAYYALLEASRWQATLGKRAMGIEVVDIGGGRATLLQTSVRFVLRLVSGAIFGLGFLLAMVTSRRQTLHDLCANCVVVKATRQSAAGALTGG